MSKYLMMCPDCLNVFEMKKNYKVKNSNSIMIQTSCPLFECYGELFEIDENFIEVIRVLRTKGYNTAYCCSDHHNNFNPSIVVQKTKFRPYIKLIGDGVNELLYMVVNEDPRVTDYGFEFDFVYDGGTATHDYKIRSSVVIYYTTEISNDSIESYTAYFDGIMRFIKFAHGLPSCNEYLYNQSQIVVDAMLHLVKSCNFNKYVEFASSDETLNCLLTEYDKTFEFKTKSGRTIQLIDNDIDWQDWDE